MLLIFGGLPASGKSTISKGVARKLVGAHISVDTIEETLKNAGFAQVYSEGYEIAYQLAADNLSLGLSVVTDSCNAINLTRDAWRAIGHKAGVQVLEIEIVCSHQIEHQQRLETRSCNGENPNQLTWDDVLNRKYEPWVQANIKIDTAGESVAQSLEKTLSLIERYKS